MMPLADHDDADGAARGRDFTGQCQVFGIDARHQHVIAARRQGIRKTAHQDHKKRIRDALTGHRIDGQHHRDRPIAL